MSDDRTPSRWEIPKREPTIGDRAKLEIAGELGAQASQDSRDERVADMIRSRALAAGLMPEDAEIAARAAMGDGGAAVLWMRVLDRLIAGKQG